MSLPRETPKSIEPTEDGSRLRIAWEDGATTEHTPWDLRIACPCAACVDELTGEPLLDPAGIDPGVYPMAIHYVGRYALQFMWSDGHQTGIYPFAYLRQLAGPGSSGAAE